MYKKSNRIICMGLMLCMTSAMILGGCGQKSENSGKIEIELVQYKPEAVKTFEKIEEEFNATHDDIHLKMLSLLCSPGCRHLPVQDQRRSHSTVQDKSTYL